ncbi:MAG TPA: ABC transporter transmembrane domain-containing protein [Gemmataceae bacterium]|nr:ABC transporter transmembrane domain-containing protein [Gemmataceae bacterium]
MARFRRNDSDQNEDLPRTKITREGLRQAARLLKYVRPYWVKFIGAAVAMTLSSLLGLAFPYIVGKLVNAGLPGAPVDNSLFSVLDVNAIALIMMVVLAFQAAFSYLQAILFTEVGERSLTDLRRDVYSRLIRLSMTFHIQRRVGELSSRIAADVAQIEDTATAALPQFLRQSAMLIGSLVLIAVLSGPLTLLMLSVFPALIAIAVVFGRLIRRNSKQAQDGLAESNVIVEETLQGIASVKAFANENYEQARYSKGLDGFLAKVLRGAHYRGAFYSFIIFALFGALVLVMWSGCRMVQARSMTIGALASFMLYTMYAAGAMGSFADLYSQIQRALGATQRIRELLAEKTEEELAPLPSPLVGEALSSSPLPRFGAEGPGVRGLDGAREAEPLSPGPSPRSTGERGEKKPPPIRGDVIFDVVTFRYPSRPDVEVLRGVNLSARAGQRIALVGPSGAGKSTVVSLLLRFYEPTAGRVRIDGRDARQYSLRQLRERMAVVPQDVLLFGGTILDNIAYGRPGATEAEVIEAARQANAHDFISTFPEGYQTRVGDRGVQLSGGQRQRVAIARAILRDPAILILDEATSSLDSESESLVLQALDRLMQGRTSLVIAHRLSTVRSADRIFVLKEGATIEEGTHDELLSRPDGVYRTLSLLQLDGAGRSPSPEKEEALWRNGAATTPLGRREGN